MEKRLKKFLKTLKVNENLISTLMGGVVILVMGVMIFNYFKSINNTGSITNEAAVQLEQAQVQNEGEVPSTMPETYKVKEGDDLWHIAESVYGSGYNYVDIVKENKIANPNIIEKDIELKLPKVESRKLTTSNVKAVQASGNKNYTVQPGDHLWKIAVANYGDGYSWTKIYNANKDKIGSNPSAIEKGMVLVIP